MCWVAAVPCLVLGAHEEAEELLAEIEQRTGPEPSQ
jgi:hypothetical protein